METEIRRALNFQPSENLGQHILIDAEVIRRFANMTIPGSNVIEIGSGPGNLTEPIARRASRVIGVEIDPRYRETAGEVAERNHNVELRYGDVLKMDFDKEFDRNREAEWQIMGNIPFHTSEPLLAKLAKSADRIRNVVLIVGDKLARIMSTSNPSDPIFSKVSLLAQGVFEVRVEDGVPKKSFWPQPRTDAKIVTLTPREAGMGVSGTKLRVINSLLQSGNSTVVKAIKEAVQNGSGDQGKYRDKALSHRFERRQSRAELKNMVKGLTGNPTSQRSREQTLASGSIDSVLHRLNLPSEILSKPFSRLDNREVRILAEALKKI